MNNYSVADILIEFDRELLVEPLPKKDAKSGARFINDFFPAIQIRWKFRCRLSDRNNFSHMARQHSCRAMHKILYRSLY